jgi:hypothetical protein
MPLPKLYKNSLKIMAFALAGGAAACGISLGSGSIDDPLPSGTIVAQGSLGGQNGHTVSGVVSVWQQNNSSACTFVLRLQTLSAPTDASLRVIPLVNGAPSVSPTFYSLRGSTGNQNYTFTGATCGATWAQVSITNPNEAVTSAQTYGTATLTAP